MELNLENQRIKLRELRISDARFIYQIAKDKEVTKYTFVISPPYELKRVKKLIKKIHQGIQKKKTYQLGVELKKTNHLIGMMSLINVDWKNKNTEVGFWLDKKYWREGLAKEGLKLILKLAFKKLKLKRIQARILHKNIPTQRLLENLGFKLEGRLRKKTFFKKKWYDDLIYSLLSEEYLK